VIDPGISGILESGLHLKLNLNFKSSLGIFTTRSGICLSVKIDIAFIMNTLKPLEIHFDLAVVPFIKITLVQKITFSTFGSFRTLR